MTLTRLAPANLCWQNAKKLIVRHEAYAIKENKVCANQIKSSKAVALIVLLSLVAALNNEMHKRVENGHVSISKESCVSTFW